MLTQFNHCNNEFISLWEFHSRTTFLHVGVIVEIIFWILRKKLIFLCTQLIRISMFCMQIIIPRCNRMIEKLLKIFLCRVRDEMKEMSMMNWWSDRKMTKQRKKSSFRWRTLEQCRRHQSSNIREKWSVLWISFIHRLLAFVWRSASDWFMAWTSDPHLEKKPPKRLKILQNTFLKGFKLSQ